MNEVAWQQTALNELASIWVPAESEVRHAITAASNQIDEDLSADPELGESRPGGLRVYFVHPLGISFDYDATKSLVRVLHVWDIRRKKKP